MSSSDPQLVDSTPAQPRPAQDELPDRQLTDGQRAHREHAHSQCAYRCRADGNGSFVSYRRQSGHHRCPDMFR